MLVVPAVAALSPTFVLTPVVAGRPVGILLVAAHAAAFWWPGGRPHPAMAAMLVRVGADEVDVEAGDDGRDGAAGAVGYLRHSNYLLRIDPVTTGSAATVKQDATFRIGY